MRYLKTKTKKAIAVMCIAIVMSVCVSNMSVSAAKSANYEVSFTSGAPSYINKMSFSKTVEATAAGRITVNSKSFSTYINGAYIYVYCDNYTATTQNVNSVHEYYLDYIGGMIPQINEPVIVNGTLENYGPSRTVDGSGTISA